MAPLGGQGIVALLVWGDPSLYDSTLRIAARLNPAPAITVIPGVTSMQVLTAGHAIPVNEVGAPFTVTTWNGGVNCSPALVGVTEKLPEDSPGMA